jgi:hypothetical protein
MPKYRSLTTEELQELEKEFVEFLVINGIIADDWVKIKKEDPEKAEKMIDLFSDVVMEGTLRKVQFIEHHSRKEVKAFQCLPEKMIMMGMRSGSDEVNFSDPQFLQESMKNPPADLEVFTLEKKYHKPREVEIFEMTEAGCEVSNGSLFKALSLVYADNS